MILPLLSYISLKPGLGLISPLTFKKGEKRKRTYIHVFPSFVFVFFVFVKQVIAQKFKQSQVRLNPRIHPQ